MRRKSGSRWFVWLLLAVALVLGWQYWQRPEGPPKPATGSSTEVPLPIPPRAPATTPAATTPTAPPLTAPSASPAPEAEAEATSLPAFLPQEARATIALIQRGGPFPYRQDGSVFGNREGLLPRQPRGWYREYTVDTPGLSHRGARRIVTGGNPPREWYYSDDHYRSFRAFTAPGGAP
jgi:guanyl-specific ribonuclease Sa